MIYLIRGGLGYEGADGAETRGALKIGTAKYILREGGC